MPVCHKALRVLAPGDGIVTSGRNQIRDVVAARLHGAVFSEITLHVDEGKTLTPTVTPHRALYALNSTRGQGREAQVTR